MDAAVRRGDTPGWMSPRISLSYGLATLEARASPERQDWQGQDTGNTGEQEFEFRMACCFMEPFPGDPMSSENELFWHGKPLPFHRPSRTETEQVLPQLSCDKIEVHGVQYGLESCQCSSMALQINAAPFRGSLSLVTPTSSNASKSSSKLKDLLKIQKSQDLAESSEELSASYNRKPYFVSRSFWSFCRSNSDGKKDTLLPSRSKSAAESKTSASLLPTKNKINSSDEEKKKDSRKSIADSTSVKEDGKGTYVSCTSERRMNEQSWKRGIISGETTQNIASFHPAGVSKSFLSMKLVTTESSQRSDDMAISPCFASPDEKDMKDSRGHLNPMDTVKAIRLKAPGGRGRSQITKGTPDKRGVWTCKNTGKSNLSREASGVNVKGLTLRSEDLKASERHGYSNSMRFIHLLNVTTCIAPQILRNTSKEGRNNFPNSCLKKEKPSSVSCI